MQLIFPDLAENYAELQMVAYSPGKCLTLEGEKKISSILKSDKLPWYFPQLMREHPSFLEKGLWGDMADFSHHRSAI